MKLTVTQDLSDSEDVVMLDAPPAPSAGPSRPSNLRPKPKALKSKKPMEKQPDAERYQLPSSATQYLLGRGNPFGEPEDF